MKSKAYFVVADNIKLP